MEVIMVSEELMAAVIADREREVTGFLKAHEAAKARRANTSRRRRRWRWQVQPGMEEEFSWLRGWFLSGADEGDMTH